MDSSASISLAEMKANVGITEDEAGTPVPRHIVQRARQKIRAIGMRLEAGGFDSRRRWRLVRDRFIQNNLHS